MYNVASRFHTLAIADSPKTRCRIYFISDAVNCWDDNDVQSNGTLLVGAAGDTDSNGRIGQGGVTVTEIFNKDKNLTLGGTVSYQIGMTLVNSDGALNNFAFGRCKVYLDVYDDTNSTWLPCPLGVFRIELPVKRKVQLISCTGYDQMQALNAIADTWWNGLNFTGGFTIENILNSMVTQLGLHLSATSSTSMVNKTLPFTTPPIDSVERTYRDILGWIAEATGTVAHFNRDGELDMRQYLTPQIGGNNIVIDTDTTGNQCLSIDVAEYQVAQIDALTIKLTTSDQGVTVGSGTNVYTIMDNPFLYGPDVATIQGKLTPIYNRLSAYATYSPISTRLIYDWSIEAGDIIYILNNSTTYNMPIFQQKMVWRGGYVTSELISSGDTVRPQVSSGERETYRYNVEMATKVGDNEIISKINQTAEQIQIQASKVNLTGYITATNLATAGQTVINGGNITTGTISADRIAAGSLSISKLDSATQNTITTAASDASTALANAATAQSTANSANSQEQLIYISKVSGTTSVSGTTTWVTNTTGNQNTWTIKRPVYNSSYPVLFVATQRKSVGGTVTCTTPQIDQTTTVIDGGHITTGTIDAGVVNVTNINASNITSGELSANRISGGTLIVGGQNNENGTIVVKDASGNTTGTIDNTGANIYGSLSSSQTVGGVSFSTQISGANIKINNGALPMFTVVPKGDGTSDGRVSMRGSNATLYLTGSDLVYSARKNGNPFTAVSMGVSGTDPNSYGGLSLAGPSADGSRIQSIDLNPSGISRFGSSLGGGDVEINGVLDVTQRRCFASLSSYGWYRVIRFDADNSYSTRGADGSILDIDISRQYNYIDNEAHHVRLIRTYNNNKFVGEESVSNTLGVDKVRLMADLTNNKAYIDIHYTPGTENPIGVNFHVSAVENYADDWFAESMQYVAPSPSGETVLTEYTFAANTYNGMRYYRESVGSITIGSNGFATMTMPSQIVGRKIVNIMLVTLSTISGGAVSILSYTDASGNARSNYYMAGSVGASITNVIIEYWYL